MTEPLLNYLIELIESLPWAVAGFLAGCLATQRATRKLQPSNPHEDPSMTPTAPPKRRKRFTLVHFIGLVVIGLTIMSAVQVWVQSRNSERLTRCLVTYANQTADAIEIRSKASAEAQRATVQMWRTVFEQPQTDEGRAAARRVFEAYLAAQEASIRTQQTNPYPDAPRDLCPESAR